MKSFFEQVVFDVDSSICTEVVDDPAIGRIFHFHPEFELTYVERGSGWRFVGERIVEMQDGELTLLGSMLPHLFVNRHYFERQSVSSGGAKAESRPLIRVIKFARNFGLREEIQLPEFAAIRKLLDDSAGGVLFPAAATTAAEAKILRIFSVRGIHRLTTLWEMLHELALSDYRPLDGGHENRAAERRGDARIHRVLHFIEARLNSGVVPSLGEAAAFACLSPEAFSRYFRQTTRKSFIEYVSELKIGRAMRLLQQKHEMSICEIACSCGFGNLSNFNRQFRKFNRMTPREYRELAGRAFPVAGATTAWRRTK